MVEINKGYMTDRSPDAAANKPPVLSKDEIHELLSSRLIANLATLNDDGDIHILPMWFLRVGDDICIPTSRYTHKYGTCGRDHTRR
jgi:nitroimidazol reductase NimA-like FMN-containing flavoprotein (pyridoxamine 5'-phosphate oxidase superfamily)